jgi:hypothetical protein
MIFRGFLQSRIQRIDEKEEAWWLKLERQERVVMLSAAVGKGWETHKLKVRHRKIYCTKSTSPDIEVTIESIKQTSLVFYLSRSCVCSTP